MQKRIFDILFSVVLIFLIWPIIFLSFILASIDTKSFGIFKQERVGQFGNIFNIYKLKTITWSEDKINFKISKIGAFLRKYKIDELPQFYNILKGDMSVVGPRPDIPGYYDKLVGKEKELLKLKPGLTSEASIKYHKEEEILKNKKNPLKYNDTVIFPDKVKINLAYLNKMSVYQDIKIIIKTLKTYI